MIIAFSKFLPHEANFSPIAGLAIFGGFMFGKRKEFFLVTILALFVSDFVLNNFVHPEYFPDREGLVIFAPYMTGVYLSIIIMVLFARIILKRFNYLKLIITSLGSSLIFYLITNFVYLYSTSMYPHNFAGMIESYIAAVPFFRTSLVSDLIFSIAIFGIYHLVSSRIFEKTSIFSISK